jgi:hypothetical protein
MLSVYNGRIISKNYDNEAWKLISNHTHNIISYENPIHNTNKAIEEFGICCLFKPGHLNVTYIRFR